MYLLKALFYAQAAFALSTQRPYSHHYKPSKGAAYFLENNPAGNNIVCIEILVDRLQGHPVRTSTGGIGSFQTDTAGAPAAVDPLGSQGAVKISGKHLFTVNAGSNTASMFSIDPQDPCALHLVGEPSATAGKFPISVDYSPQLRLACVLNGGSKAGLGCFDVHPSRGLGDVGPLHGLPVAVVNETTPPSGPPGSAAQVAFKPDSSSILATIKGDAGTTPVRLG